MGYLRVVTHPAVLPAPLGPKEATRNAASLLSLPHVRAPSEDPGFWDIYPMTRGAGARANDVPDVHLAALMRQHGVSRVYSRDRDFRRFDGIEVRDPIT